MTKSDRINVLDEEYFRLDKRYNKDYERAAAISERSLDAYTNSNEAKRIIDRIIEINRERSIIVQDL
jgi:arginyl-tRNA--protein-N-Asp/Glu arginylyltransferase